MAAALAFTTAEARTAADFFASAPDNIIPMLRQSTRLDMLDYARFGSDKASKSYLKSDARVTAETPQVVSYEISERVSQQIAMLTAGTDTIVAFVTTYKIPTADSSIEFFDTNWKRLEKQPIAMPTYEEWLTKGEDISATLPFVTATAVFSPDASTLTITPTVQEFLPDFEYQKIASRLVAQRVYNISGTKFSLKK
jgi:hypothetical protein